jgi:hypothetical protein
LQTNLKGKNQRKISYFCIWKKAAERASKRLKARCGEQRNYGLIPPFTTLLFLKEMSFYHVWWLT